MQRVRRIGRSGRSVVVLFVPAAVLGGAGMIALRVYEFGPVYAVALGCAMIALYALVALLLKPAALPTGLIGDNCYYLGFVFTLLSLSWTLFALSQGTNEDKIVEVVSGFGIALLTTLAGLVARVALNPPRVDLADEEQMTRVSLAREAYLLQRELVQTTAAHKQFGQIVRQSLDEFKGQFTHDLTDEAKTRRKIFAGQMAEHEAAISKHLEAFAKQSIDRFDTAMQEHLKTRLQNFNDTATAMTDAATSGAASLEQVVGDLGTAVDGFAETADGFGTKVSTSLNTFGTTLDTAATSLGTTLERAMVDMDAITTRLAMLNERLEALEQRAGPPRSFWNRWSRGHGS